MFRGMPVKICYEFLKILLEELQEDAMITFFKDFLEELTDIYIDKKLKEF